MLKISVCAEPSSAATDSISPEFSSPAAPFLAPGSGAVICRRRPALGPPSSDQPGFPTARRSVPRTRIGSGHLPAPQHHRRLTLLGTDLNQQALPQIPCSHANRVQKIDQGSCLPDSSQQERHILIRRCSHLQRPILHRGCSLAALVLLIP